MRSSLGPEVKNSRSFSERNYMVQSLKRVICNVFDKYANYTSMQTTALVIYSFEFLKNFIKPGFKVESRVVSILVRVETVRRRWSDLLVAGMWILVE
ncbi:Uncharacterized protein HZ326_23814 [Fusarium oxysporum f. sp. albedinis]|nr:Uncharacterized protein HZ326_23814 [Fusarium oxysporum f. sp. albedinis]